MLLCQRPGDNKSYDKVTLEARREVEVSLTATPARCGDRLRGRLLYSPLFPRPSRGLVCPTRLRASLVAPTWYDSETFVARSRFRYGRNAERENLSIARERQDVTYLSMPFEAGRAGVTACPTREGASDNLAPGSAGGTTVNKEGDRVGGRHKGKAVSQRFEEILAPREDSTG